VATNPDRPHRPAAIGDLVIPRTGEVRIYILSKCEGCGRPVRVLFAPNDQCIQRCPVCGHTKEGK